MTRRLVLGFHAVSLALRDDHCDQDDTLAHVRTYAPDFDEPLKLIALWNWNYRRRKFAGQNLADVFQQERVPPEEDSISLHGSFETRRVAPGSIFVYVVHVPNILSIAQTAGPNPVGLRAFGFRLSGEFSGVGRAALAVRLVAMSGARQHWLVSARSGCEYLRP
jgi:hypothetical protein